MIANAVSVPVAARSGKGVLRLKVTLLGVKKTTGGVATASRVTPMGLASSAVKSATGRGGTLTGSVLFAVELFDGAGAVQAAAIRRRAPDALDIKATLSTGDTVKAVGRGLGPATGRVCPEDTAVRGSGRGGFGSWRSAHPG